MKIDARDWVFEVEVPGDQPEDPAVWTEICRINTWELDPNANSETVDTTDFCSGGEFEGQVMQRGGSLEMEGHRAYDRDTGARDPGQAYVDLLGTKVSDESIGRLRFRHKTEEEWTVWRAYVELGGVGGGNNDKTSWAATYTRSGKATVAPVLP